MSSRFCGLFLALPIAMLVGCAGDGTGQVSGTLFLRGCPDLDPTTPGSFEVPNPLPPFSLDPQYFFGEVMRSIQQGMSTADPRGIDRISIRLQRSSTKTERADTFDLLVYDLDRFPAVQDAALARGEQGVPIIPPAVDGQSMPLPPDPTASVRADISLNSTCWFPRIEPLLSGYVHFSSLGRDLGDEVAGDFAVTIEDARAIREMSPAPDVAGSLSGWFRFPLRSGPAVPAL